MKKFCILLMLFSFLSIMPSYALKVIVNEATDRKVPSRSSVPEPIEDYSEQQQMDYVSDEDNQQQNADKKSEYSDKKYELVYKPLLGGAIRPELVGTTWNYPVNNFVPEEKIQEKQVSQNIDSEKNQEKEVILKRYLREAADYYYIDTIGSPNNVVPAGFEIYPGQ